MCQMSTESYSNENYNDMCQLSPNDDDHLSDEFRNIIVTFCEWLSDFSFKEVGVEVEGGVQDRMI